MNNSKTPKRSYQAPAIEEVGLVARITMGMGGSCCDGNLTRTQNCQGVPGQGPGNPGGPPGQC